MPNLTLNKFTVVMTTVVALLASPLSLTVANAGMAMNNPEVLAIKKKVIEAMIAGTEAAVQKQVDLDTDAAASEDCNDLHARAVAIAKETVTASKPPEPSKIIQNSTCFVDLAQFDIPIMVTSSGIGFIDAIIDSYIHQFITDGCSAATGFLDDITGGALSAFDGVNLDNLGSMVFDYAAAEIPELAAVADLGTLPANDFTGQANAYLNLLTNVSNVTATIDTSSLDPNDPFFLSQIRTPEVSAQLDNTIATAGSILTPAAVSSALTNIKTPTQLSEFQCALGQKNATCP